MRAEPGTTFGLWTVVARGEPARSGRPRVLCRCECGLERLVQIGNLVSGGSRSCGRKPCIDRGLGRRLPPGDQARNFIFLNYQSTARAKAREWALTREQFETLTASACSYCGTPPANRTKDRWGDGAFVYSGLDRVDPNLGYTIDNVVPACIICNRAKTNMTIEEFRAWLRRAASVTLKGGRRGKSVASRGK